MYLLQIEEYTDPVSYTKVTDKDGNIILEKKPAYNTVYDEATAFVMTDMLKDVCRPSRRPNEANSSKTWNYKECENQIIPTQVRPEPLMMIKTGGLSVIQNTTLVLLVWL